MVGLFVLVLTAAPLPVYNPRVAKIFGSCLMNGVV
jgi:hypothetical protein